MAWAVNVVFSPGGKVYSFDPNGLELAWDQRVICNTSRGLELARVVTGNHEVERSQKEPPLRVIERHATREDEERVKENRAAGRKAMLAFRDAPGSSASAANAHGSGFDRVSSFQNGYEGGGAACVPYFDKPPVVTEMCAMGLPGAPPW